MDGARTRTGIAGYLGGVLEAVEELVVDTRECVEGVFEHTDAMQRSVLRTAKRALRAEGRSGAADDLAVLRAEIADLTARLRRFEATASAAAAPATPPSAPPKAAAAADTTGSA